MIVSHSCNPLQSSKPAAKCTTGYRLRHATTPLFGGRFAPAPRSGFTLVEVLVAMAILLVGIWALAVGFPKLLGVIALEEKRTEMARQAQRTLDQLTRTDQQPLAIRGDTALPAPYDPKEIDANLPPADPDIADFGITPPNSRDDMIEIRGEGFTVPAPDPTTPYPMHVFRQGLAAPGETGAYEVLEATTGVPQAHEVLFTINPATGQVTLSAWPADYTPPFAHQLWFQVSYQWIDDSYDPGNPAHDEVYYVNGEEVQNNGVVLAALNDTDTDFWQIVDVAASNKAHLYYGVAVSGSPDATDPVRQHATTGAVLALHPYLVGRDMRVDYALRREPLRDDRRALIMTEEHRIISRPQIITLVGSHIDDEVPLPLGLASPTYLLAVDLNTGDYYAEGSGLEFQGDDGAAAGRVQITVDPLVGVGHDLRFYYSTLDQDLITLQTAPQAFIDHNVLGSAGGTELLYRSYRAVNNFYNNTYRDLLFYPCNAGHTVTVDYTCMDSGDKLTIDSEMHTISTDKGYNENHPELHTITLLYPNVEEIIAVTGVSLKARAWWRAPSGRLEKLDIVTVR